jgi:O-antigen ligase
MKHIISAALALLAIGIFTSVTVLSIHQGLFAIPVIYFTFLALKNKEFKLPLSAWFLVGFTIVAAISLFVNYPELVKPGKNFGRLKYLAFGFLAVFPLRYYLKQGTEKYWGHLSNLFLAVISLVAVICLYQFFIMGQPRAKSLTDTLRYGYGMGIILPVLVSIYLRPGIIKGLNQKLLLGTILLGAAGLYVTLTRGAMLGFLCAVPFSVLLWNFRKGLIVFGVAGTVVATLVGFYLFGSGDLHKGNRFLTSKNNASDDIRKSQWKGALIAFQEHPAFGIGYSDYINRTQEIKAKNNLPHAEYQGHAHNIWLETLSGTGLIGILFFAAWLITWAIEMFKANTDLKGIIIPFGVAVVISGEFEVILDANNSSMIFFIYALSVVLNQFYPKSTYSSSTQKRS